MSVLGKVFLIFLLTFVNVSSDLIDHLKPVGRKKVAESQIRNIDYIYVISLEKRNARWANALKQLLPYKILPHRFYAINGWALSSDVLNDVGILYSPEMQRCPNSNTYGAYFLNDKTKKEVNLNENCYGKKYVSHFTTLGAIGCYLSHLSVLEDAYNSGYQTIWVIEDDMKLYENPHMLSDLIDSLDRLVGASEWDLLYTDFGVYGGFGDDSDRDLAQYEPIIWRPDMKQRDTSYLIEYRSLEGFFKVGRRAGTTSMIIRRSGMKKILDFAKNQGIFLPIDNDLAFVPNLNKYGPKEHYVSCERFSSDTEINRN